MDLELLPVAEAQPDPNAGLEATRRIKSSESTAGIILVVEVLAALSILHVIIKARPAPGAWGWLMAMLAVPFIAVPIYWILGRQHFRGYVEQFREAREENEQVFHDLEESLQLHIAELTDTQDYYGGLLLQLSERRFTGGNEVCLLIDSE